MRLSGLDGRVAVVTGAASGIGQAVVRRLAREGVSVAAADVYEAGLTRLTRGSPGKSPTHGYAGCRPRQTAGGTPISRLNARVNAASDS